MGLGLHGRSQHKSTDTLTCSKRQEGNGWSRGRGRRGVQMERRPPADHRKVCAPSAACLSHCSSHPDMKKAPLWSAPSPPFFCLGAALCPGVSYLVMSSRIMPITSFLVKSCLTVPFPLFSRDALPDLVVTFLVQSSPFDIVSGLQCHL